MDAHDKPPNGWAPVRAAALRSSHLEFGWSRPHGANRRWHIRGSKPRIRARNSPIPRADFTYTNTQVSVWSTPASEGFEKRFKLFWSHLKRLSGGRHFSLALLLLKYLRRVETKSRTPVPARPPSGRGTANGAGYKTIMYSLTDTFERIITADDAIA